MKQNSCYKITRLLNGPTVTYGPGYDDTSVLWSSLPADCRDALCPDCDPGLKYLKFTGCCDDEEVFFQGTGPGPSEELSQQQQVNYTQYVGLIDFIGTPIDGLIDQCYTVEVFTVETGADVETLAEWQDLPSPPIFQGNFDYLNKLPLCDPAGDGTSPCLICDEVCYRVWNCDGEFFDTTNDLSADVFTGSNFVILNDGGVDLPGSWIVLLNEGLCDNAVSSIAVTGAAPACVCTCYEVTGSAAEITYIDCDGVFTKEYAPAKFCSLITPLVKGDPLQYQLTTGDACVDGECPEQCFILTNCDPTAWPLQDAVLNSTLQNLSQYVNTSEVVVLSGYDGCWIVTEAICNCITITINGAEIETTLWGTHNGNPVFSFVYLGITYYIWYNGAGTWIISLEIDDITGRMADAESEDACPITSGTLAWAISGSFPAISTLTTELCPDQCICPVDVTVIRDHEDCEDCLGITAYKLTNCEKINEVVYTTQDLSAYVGQVIKDDCNCWTVEEIDYQPPSETTIVDPILYTDCSSCLSTYYTLTDCAGVATTIITSTNLSAYVDQVVKLQGCTECYIVTLYTDLEEPSSWEDVTVTEGFADCPTCQDITPRCSTVFNNGTTDRTFTYINANGDSQETEIVKSGHFSLRHCVQYWDEVDTFIYNYYGDCTVYEHTETPEPADCNCIDVTVAGPNIGDLEVHKAIVNGDIYNGEKVYNLIVNGIEYFIWYVGAGGWQISQVVGDITDSLGVIKIGVPDCPVTAVDWTPGEFPDGSVVLSIITAEGDCLPVTIKEGFCVQYFPNSRKVKPGYNTPICSADKYDKITCKAAEIMYKKVLELRYGISNCCPEEDEKWLISKELIELQALTDPNYTCDPLTDCCGQPVSSCSCNS